MSRPVALTVAALIAVVEAAVLVVMAILSLTKVTTMSTTAAAFFVIWAAALVACAWGLWRLHSWARSPIVLFELITLGLAWDAHHSNAALAIVLAILSLATLVGVFHPRSIEALASQ